jgi:hypothetical protein
MYWRPPRCLPAVWVVGVSFPHLFLPGTLVCRTLHSELVNTRTLITNKCIKRVLSSILTHSYVFRPCWVIFRENFFVIVALRLHFIVAWECAVDCVPQAGTAESSRLQKQRSTQSTAHSQAGTAESSRFQKQRSTVNSTFSLNYKVQP